jgi:uncharacterized repeat protein (TIGR01451 family)
MRRAILRLPFVPAVALLLAFSPGVIVAGTPRAATPAAGHITFGATSLVAAGPRQSSSASNGGTTFGIVTSPTDGTSYLYSVGFTDDNPGAGPATLSGSIDWGDGNVSAASISGGSGSFTASGTHSWLDEGPEVVTLTITDTSTTPSSTATDTTTYTVSEGDLSVGNGSLSLTEGSTTSGTVLTFTDGAGGETDNPFSAVVDWGDGTSETATVSGPVAGVYSVAVPESTHAFADEGSFTATVTVTEAGLPQTPLFVSHVTVGVGEGDILSAPTLNLTAATEGTPIAASTTLATFTDSYADNVASDFTATIDWGDSATEAGVVTKVGSTITVSAVGGHTYADEGTFGMSVTLTDDAPGTASSTASGDVSVAEADVLGEGSLSLTAATEGTPIAAGTTIASVPDTGYPTNAAGDFSATIDWGDGSPIQAGTVSITAGVVSVAASASHTYADEGKNAVTVVITDDAPGTASVTLTGDVVVAEADTLAGAMDVTAVAHVFSGKVATFTDPGYPTNSAGDFTATIDWGDGSPLDTGTVAAGSPGTFDVSGSHTYAPGVTSTTITVTLTDDAPGTATASVSGTVAVLNPPTISKAFGAAAIDLGQATSLTFTIANPNPAPISGVGFTDVLPAGLRVAFPAGLLGSCGGGTITALPFSSFVSLSGATLAANASCTFSVRVVGTSPGTKLNHVTVQSDAGPGNTATASILVRASDLTISKSHTGTFRRGWFGTYTIVVSNLGPSPTYGTVTVTDPAPLGMVGVSVNAPGWTCTSKSLTLSCNRSDPLAPGASYPAISWTLNILFFGPSQVVNVATVAGGGELNTANDSAADPTTVTFF